MNIFYLHNDPKTCAEMHVDKHCVKMILEYAQLLSTAHRVLDGTEYIGKSVSGRKAKRFLLSDDRESHLYLASHLNHPSGKWVRHSASNYLWLFKLWIELMREYNYRYGKIHSAAKLIPYLKNLPNNIKENGFCAPWRAMPDEYKVDRNEPDYTIKSYRAYYLGAKTNMFKWKNREIPEWIVSV